MLSRTLLDTMYKQYNDAKQLRESLEKEDTFPDEPGVVDIHRERIKAATDREMLMDLLIDIYLSDK